MSKFIAKVFDIWQDLEVAYEKQGSGLSRRDFLFKLIGRDAQGVTKLDSLKSKVMEHYEGNEFECDVLAKIFDAVADADLSEIDEIDNLNEFVGSLIQGKKVATTISKVQVSEDLLESLNPYRFADTIESVDLATHLSSDFATDVFKLQGKDIVSSIVGFNNPDGVVVFKAADSFNNFVNIFKPENEFLTKCYSYISAKVQKGLLPTFIIFVRDDLFYKRGEVVTLKLQGIKVKLALNDTETIADNEYFLCSHRNDYLETEVVCVK